MRFSDIPGLDETKNLLLSGIHRNHVAHAQIFYGPAGSPNLALALAYITFLNCENSSQTDSCGECSSCRKIDKLVHPDINFVFPVSPYKSIKGKDVISDSFVKEWRSFVLQNTYGDGSDWLEFYGFENKQGNISKEESRHIIKTLSLKSFEAKYKVMLIWLPEYMHPAAANSILKILEEPPEQTLFLLVTHEYERLLSTITSRSQLMLVRKFHDDELKELLIRQEKIEPQQASDLARRSDGSMSEALRIIRESSETPSDIFGEWMRTCWKPNLSGLVEQSSEFSSLSKVAQKSTFQHFLGMLRNALVMPHSENLVQANDGEKTFIKNFSKAMNSQKLEFMIREINSGIYHLERNANPKILFLDLSLKISSIIRG